MVITAKFTVYEKLSKNNAAKLIMQSVAVVVQLNQSPRLNPPASSANALKQNGMRKHMHQLVHPVIDYQKT